MQANEPQWWRPEYLGRPAAAEALTTIASPLFAGFSVTLIGVIAQDSKEFALPGPAMLVLAVAAICFMISLQCGFQARLYQTSPADVAAWNPGYDVDADQLRAEKSAQFTASMGYIGWELRSYFYYSLGLAALLAGLGLTLWPPPTAEQPLWRWVGVGLVAVALLFELFWSFGDDLWAKYPRVVHALGLEPLFNAWYRPARRLRRKGRLPLPDDEVSADGQQEVPPGRLPPPGPPQAQEEDRPAGDHRPVRRQAD